MLDAGIFSTFTYALRAESLVILIVFVKFSTMELISMLSTFENSKLKIREKFGSEIMETFQLAKVFL